MFFNHKVLKCKLCVMAVFLTFKVNLICLEKIISYNKRQMSTCNHGPIKKNCGELSKRLKTIAVQSWLIKNTFFY